ncbi:MAG: radical SAM protein [Spirochaetales bacterium]|nr:radical SAM protein [Spirochaetales bacterium]
MKASRTTGTRRSRVVLVSIHLARTPQNLPLGAACVASALKQAEASRDTVDPVLLDGYVTEPGTELAKRIIELAPDLVGFSVYVWSREAAAACARELRSMAPGLFLVAGGAEATADPEGLLSAAPFDAIIAGEGERAGVSAITELLARGSASVAAGVFVRGETVPRIAPRRTPPEDVTRLPSPWLDGTLVPGPYGGALWELARGCPFGCTFCYESRGHRGARRFALERIEAELELFVRSGIAQVMVLDPTFNADRERAARLLRLLRERGQDLHYVIEVRAEFLDRVQARLFSELACSVQIGLQTARPEISKLVGRSLDPSLFARKVGLLNETGTVFGIDLIYGLPGDDLAGFRASLEWVLALEPNHLDVFRLSVLPGTLLFDQADSFGMARETAPPYRVLSTPTFPAADLDAAERLAKALDLFYVKGRAVAWFARALKALGARPLPLLDQFADWVEGNGGFDALSDPGSIEEAQASFLSERFAAGRQTRALPVVLDLVRLNGAWGRALAEGETTELTLGHDPEALMGPEALELRAFAAAFPASRLRYRIRPSNDGGVSIEGPLGKGDAARRSRIR